MKKIIELDEHFPTGEMTVQPILTWGHGQRVDTTRVSKYASEALDYIKHVAPEPGKTILLLNAMGAEETYGPNRNGDGFPEFPVPARGKALSVDRKWFVAPGEELTKHYRSFETNPAHAFKHHANRDPAKASGVVKKSFWNIRMKRVELLISVDNDKDPEWVNRANDGEFVPVSMGCRIKYDVCARCGNKAPTRADYCDHVKFSMNQVDSNGFKDYVHNPSPDFFDISRVFRPADRTGYTLKKVAEVYEVRLSADLGAIAEDLAQKSSAIRKLSDMDKIIRAEPVATSTLSPDEKSFIVKFRDHSQDKLARAPSIDMSGVLSWPLGEILSAATSNGIVLKDAEFVPLAISKLANQRVHLPAPLVVKVANAARYALTAFAERPELFNELLDSGVLESRKIASALIDAFAPAREKRGALGNYLYRRIVPLDIGLREDESPTTDVLHVGGRATTRGAAIDAQDAITRANIDKTLGGGALLLGGYKALTAFPGMRRLKVPLAVGTGALATKTLMPQKQRTLTTDEGIAIPETTELAPKTAAQAALVHLVECARTPMPRLKEAAFKLDSINDLDGLASALGRLVLQDRPL